MTKLAALLLTTTALSAAVPAMADVYDSAPSQNEPFFWTDLDENRATGTQTQGQAPSQGMKDSAAPTRQGSAGAPDMVTPPRPQPRDSANPQQANPTPKPTNPVMESYPVEDSPQHHMPESGQSSYFDDDCKMTPDAQTWARDHGGMGAPRDGSTAPHMHRRGEMAGDDGVLEAIQDDPCDLIHRRGGPNAASAHEYTHPSDIRRANTLEDRRIPVHDVGRYAPDGSGLWHRDPNSPFVNASRSWEIQRGTMLSHMLSAWGEEAGFNVVWRSAHDYVIQTDVMIRGTFPEAAGQVLESFSDATPPISADFYLDNRTLVVNSSSEFDGRGD